MSEDIARAYDALAADYTALAFGDLDRDLTDWDWLHRFVDEAAAIDAPVADLGCGPGHIVNHLTVLGLTAVGYDVSAGLIAEARNAFPGAEFHVDDLTALNILPSSFGGIVARYSLIHLLPSQLKAVFATWFDLLRPAAPALVSFFAAPSEATHGSPFAHAVATAYALFPATIVAQMEDVGFVDVETGLRGPVQGERALDHGTVLARKPPDR